MKKLVIAGVVLVLVVAGFIYFNNSTSNDFVITGDVIDYGTYDAGSKEDLIERLTADYLDNKDLGEETVIVFWEGEDVVFATYEEIVYGKINLPVGGADQKIDVGDVRYTAKRIKPDGETVEVIINEKKYEFKLKEGEDIYFVVEE